MKAIGVDIVDTKRIASLVEKTGDRFLNRVYTTKEIAYCQGRVTSLAARWAAKEAMSKAFGTGIGDMAFKEIEVINNDRGKPGIILHGNAQKLAYHLGYEKIELSLAHTENTAIAFVVVD